MRGLLLWQYMLSGDSFHVDVDRELFIGGGEVGSEK